MSQNQSELTPQTSVAGLLSGKPAGRARSWLRSVLTRVLSLLLFLFLWQQASDFRIKAFVQFNNVPPPTAVAAAAGRFAQSPKLGGHIWNSVRRIFVGFGIAALGGIFLGLLIGRVRWVSDALLTPLEMMRPIPAVAWIPLAILMFKTGEQSMVFITFIGAFFPILLSTIHGVESLEPRLVFVSQTLGAGPLAIFAEVILPGAMPSILTGLSIGMGTSWFSLVTAEMISGQFGIGYFTWESYTLQNYPEIILGMISIGILGMGSSWMIRRVGRLFIPWFKAEANVA